MADISTLGLAVDTTGVRRATDDLRAFVQQGAIAEQAARAIGSSISGIGGALGSATTLSGQLTQSFQGLSSSANTATASHVSLSAQISAVTQKLAEARQQSESTKDSLSGMADTLSMLKKAFVIDTVIHYAHEFATIADEANIAHARLTMIEQNYEKLNSLEANLYESANKTRTSYSATVDSFVKMNRAVTDLGMSQQASIRFSTSLSEAIQLSGSSANQAKMAMMQMSEMLASGTIGGIHLKAMINDAPMLGQAIADGLKTADGHIGVTISKMRELAHEGKLSAEDIIEALGRSADSLDNRFAKLPVTVESSMQVLKNSVMMTIDEIDKRVGASKFFSGTFTGIAGWLDKMRAGGALSEGKGFSDPNVQAGVDQLIKERESLLAQMNKMGQKTAREVGGEYGLLGHKDWEKTELQNWIADAKKFKADAQGGESTGDVIMREAKGRQTAMAKASELVEAEEKKYASKQEKFAEWLKKYRKDLEGAGRIENAETIAQAKERFLGKPRVGVEDNTDAKVLATELADKRESFAEERILYSERTKTLKHELDMGRLNATDFKTASAASDQSYITNLKQIFEEEKKLIQARMDLLAGGAGRTGADIKDTKKRNQYNDLSQKLNEVSNQERKALAEEDSKITSEHNATELAEHKAILEVQKQITHEEEKKTNAAGAYLVEIKRIQDLLAQSNASNLSPEQKQRNAAVLDMAVIRANETFKAAYAKEQAEAWKKYREDLRNASDATSQLKDLTLQAADEIQKNLGTYTKDLLSGNFKDIGSMFEKMVDDMIVKAATAQLNKALFGSAADGIGSTGGLGDGLLSMGVNALFGGGSSAGVGVTQDASLFSSGASILGRHAEGGMTNPGGMYEVGEKGPELYNEGGKQYLLAGSQGGHVTRNSQIGDGGGNANVNVTILGNAQVKSDKTTSGPDGSSMRDLVIQVISSDIANGGHVADAMQGTYGLNRWNGAR